MGQEKETYTEQEAHRHFAVQLNGEVWGLLERADRSEAEEGRMVHAAHASCYHWLQVGTPLHHQRGVWLIARVYAVLGRGEAAVRYAEQCQALTEAHADLMKDFDRAFALEGLARAYAVAGKKKEALEYLKLAQEAGEAIADEEDRGIFQADLDGGDWHGVK